MVEQKEEVKSTNPAPKAASVAPKPQTQAQAPAPKVDEASKKIAELEAALKASQNSQAALTDYLEKRAGISIEDVKEQQRVESEGKDIIAVNIGRAVVSINGIKYTGSFKVPRTIAEVIVSAAGNYRNQILKEKIGNKYQVRQLETGGISSRLVGPIEPEQF